MRITRAILRIALLLINILVMLALLMAAFAGFVEPEKFILPALCGLGFEMLLLANVIMMVLWLFTSKKRYVLLSFVTLVVAYIPISHTINLSNNSKKDATEIYAHHLKVLTYNTLRLGKRKSMTENKVVEYIVDSGSDIVFLQEYEESKSGNFPKRNDIINKLSRYPYYAQQFRINNSSRNFGVAIFSKYPLINKKHIEYESTYNGAFRCDAIVGNDTIRLICIHLESNQITGAELDRPMDDARRQNTDSLTVSTMNIINKLRKAYTLRSQQAKLIAQEVEASPYKTIVCGDFNDVPISYTYHTISHRLFDAFEESGPRGFGHTFKRKWLHVRIDYILHSADFKSFHTRIDNNKGSDHYPLQTTLYWN